MIYRHGQLDKDLLCTQNNQQRLKDPVVDYPSWVPQEGPSSGDLTSLGSCGENL